MKIKKNPEWSEQEHLDFAQKVKDNDNYCPCSIERTDATRCVCEDFVNSQTLGECHCGRYVKTEI